jgi:hypothetical protein
MNSPFAIQISIKARMEVDEAYEFYESEVKGLGERFISKIYDSFIEISLNPLSKPHNRDT